MKKCQLIWLNLLRGNVCQADFLCVVYGKLIKNINTCNYNNKTNFMIITHCGQGWGSQERFHPLFFLLSTCYSKNIFSLTLTGTQPSIIGGSVPILLSDAAVV